MCDDYDDKADSLTFVITEDENGNAVLRAPLPTISFEMPEDELIRFLVALKNNEDTAKIIDGKPIGFERVVDETAFMVKLQEAVEVTNTESEILSRAISHYGEPVQVLKCIEELAELGIELSGTITADNKYFRKDMVDLVRCLTNVVNFCKYDIPSTTSEIRMLPPNEERYSDIAQETADVRIMLQQLEMFLVSPEEVHDQIDFKVKRLEKRMKEEVK